MAGVRPRCSRGPMPEPALTRRGHCAARWRQNWSVVILQADLWTNGVMAPPSPTADQRQHPRQVRRRVLWRSSARPTAPRAAAVVRRCSAGTQRARQSVCVQLPCWISSSAGRRQVGPQINPACMFGPRAQIDGSDDAAAIGEKNYCMTETNQFPEQSGVWGVRRTA